MPKWKALLMLAAIGGGCLFGAGLIFWTQAPARLQCDRISRDRVDLTVERQVLGLRTISTEALSDVINAFSVREAGSKKSGAGSSFSQNVLKLIPRQGAELRVSGIASQLNRPKAMARRIDDFINRSTDRTLAVWYVPWLLHLLALPFLFVAGLMFFALGEGLLRTVGLLPLETDQPPIGAKIS